MNDRDPHLAALERRLLLWMCIFCLAVLLAILSPELFGCIVSNP